MTILDALLLGIVQGLTEFLPISSTAHLTLVGKLLGVISADRVASWTAFIAVIQLGTLFAVLVYFFRDLSQMLISTFSDLREGRIGLSTRTLSPQTRLFFLIAVGTIPIGIAGLFLSDFLHGVFTKNLVVIGLSLIILALFLMLAEKLARHVRGMESLSVLEVVLIGCAQALALIPGSSRSGTTMTAGLFLGLTRESAARFSFLLSVPAVLASGIHELTSLGADPLGFGIANVLTATAVSAISGYAAIAWLLRFLMRKTMLVFVWYRIILGILLLGMVAFHLVEP